MFYSTRTVKSKDIQYLAVILISPGISSSFYPISLYSLIKHIVSNVKNIKEFLNFIVRYITNKQISNNKTNNLEKFKDIENSI